MKIDRRRFLEIMGHAGAAGLIGAAGACGSARTDKPPPVAARGIGRVVVAGAGLAGLVAAYRLMQRGYEVTVLEAQSRVGGRVLTRRDGLAPGLWAEMGAVRIPDVHQRTLAWIREFGLTLAEFEPSRPLRYFEDRERHPPFVRDAGQPWPAFLGLQGDEASMGTDEVWSRYLASAASEIGDPLAAGFPGAAAQGLDSMSWTDWLLSRGMSPEFLRIYRTETTSDSSVISALHWMATEIADKEWKKTFTIRGGNDQLAQAFAQRLGTRIHLESPIVRIAHTDAGVAVTHDSAGGAKTVEADYMVCAIPPTLLREVELVPVLREDKMVAIREVVMMNVGRVVLQTRSAFWRQLHGGLRGLTLVDTDAPIERVWDPSGVMSNPDGKALLIAYMAHQNADAFARVSEAERIQYGIDHMRPFFPKIEAEYDGAGFSKCWGEDPWCKGAWLALRPGQFDWLGILARPEGRIHFAGEHTSLWAGWMHGALESGERAVQEIVA